ncbi:hypothetical protein E2C01_092767 [Portunus trituberculatus]|uniref:Uncharacterized protein n=1 Tax=Portunus trituberculatus TaxID=210409 RepID=A0A5B7JL35_PORTR|nr:hypothetical protein [Portunus trituberculatus]
MYVESLLTMCGQSCTSMFTPFLLSTHLKFPPASVSMFSEHSFLPFWHGLVISLPHPSLPPHPALM